MNIFLAGVLVLMLATVAGCDSAGSGGTSSGPDGGHVDVCGALPKPAVIEDYVCVKGIAAVGTSAYWAVDPMGESLDMLIRASFPDLGVGPKTIVSTYAISQILSHQGRVYWVDKTYDSGTFLSTNVNSMAPDGSDITTLFSTAASETPFIVVNDTTLFAVDPDVGDLYAVPLTGGMPHIIASGVNIRFMAADGSFVYGAVFGSPDVQLVRIPVDGGTQETLPFPNFYPFAIAATSLFGVTPSPDAFMWLLQRVPLPGGPVVTITEDSISSLAFDASRIVWLSDGVHTAPIDGGPPQRAACIPNVMPGDIGPTRTFIAIGADNLYFTEGCMTPAKDYMYPGGTLYSLPIPKL